MLASRVNDKREKNSHVFLRICILFIFIMNSVSYFAMKNFENELHFLLSTTEVNQKHLNGQKDVKIL